MSRPATELGTKPAPIVPKNQRGIPGIAVEDIVAGALVAMRGMAPAQARPRRPLLTGGHILITRWSTRQDNGDFTHRDPAQTALPDAAAAGAARFRE